MFPSQTLYKAIAVRGSVKFVLWVSDIKIRSVFLIGLDFLVKHTLSANLGFSWGVGWCLYLIRLNLARFENFSVFQTVKFEFRCSLSRPRAISFLALHFPFLPFISHTTWPFEFFGCERKLSRNESWKYTQSAALVF